MNLSESGQNDKGIENVEQECRYCYEPASNGRLLYHPCRCSGSIRYVHKDCLVQAIISSKQSKCTTCRHKFSFVKVYAPDMPESIGIQHVVSELHARIRNLFAAFIPDTDALEFFLYFLIPLMVIGRLRSDFGYNNSFSFINFLQHFTSPQNLLRDVFNGFVFVSFNSFISFFGCLAKYQSENAGRWPDWFKPNDLIESCKNVANFFNDEEKIDNANVDNENVVVDERQIKAKWKRVEFWKLDFYGKIIYISIFFPCLRVALFISVGFCVGTLIVLVFDIVPFTIGNWIYGSLFGSVDFVVPFKYFLLLYTGYSVIGCGVPLLRYYPLSDLNRTRMEHAIAFIKVTLVSIFSNYIFYGIIAWWLDICSVFLLKNANSEIISNFGNYSWWKLFVYFQIAIYAANAIAGYVESVTTGLGYVNELFNIRFHITEINLPVLKIVQRFSVRLVVTVACTWMALWIPGWILTSFFPSFLPYQISMGFSWLDILQYMGMFQMYEQCRNRARHSCEACLQWCKLCFLSLNGSRVWKGFLITTSFFGSIVSINLLLLALPVYLGRVCITSTLKIQSMGDVQNGRNGLILMWLIFKTARKAIEIIQTSNLNRFLRCRLLVKMICKTVTVVVLLTAVLPLIIGIGFERYILYPGGFVFFDSTVNSQSVYWNIGSFVIHTIDNLSLSLDLIFLQRFQLLTTLFLICFDEVVNLGPLLKLVFIQIGSMLWFPCAICIVLQFISWICGYEIEFIAIERLVFPLVLFLLIPVVIYALSSSLFKTGQEIVKDRYFLGDVVMNLESNAQPPKEAE